MNSTNIAPTSRKGERQPSLGRNAISNLAGYFIYIGIAFFLSPFIIHRLGDARYGTWSLLAEVVGYYAFLDFGLRPAVSYYVAHYSARSEHDKVGLAISSAFYTLFVLGLLVSVAGVAFAFAFPAIFGKGEVDNVEVTTAVMIMAFTIGMSLPMEVFSSVLNGYRRQDIVSSVEILSRVLVAGGIYIALRSGHGLIAMSIIQLAGRAVTWILAVFWVRHLSGICLRPKNFHWAELRNLAKLGSMSLIINLADLAINRTDLLMTGAFLGIKWVAYYNIGRMLVQYASQLNFNITRAFTPHLTHLHSRGEFVELKRLFLIGARLSGLAAIPLAGCMLAFGHSFLGLWVGKAYVSGSLLLRSDSVMVVLVLAHLSRWPQSMSAQMLFASGNYRFLMYQTVAQAIANLALTFLLVKPYGLVGVAVGTLIPMAVCNLYLTPAYVLKRFHVSVRDYVLTGIGKPVFIGLCVFLFSYGLTHFYRPSSWTTFVIEGLLAVTVALILSIRGGLTSDERQLVMRRVRSMIGGLGAVVL